MKRILLLLTLAAAVRAATAEFDVVEATVDSIHAAFKSGKLTARQLTRMYLDRIEAYDQKGPRLNVVITVNPKALDEAAQLDAAFRKGGLVGPLHGIPVVLKDQMDVAGLRTTLGSLVFKNYVPVRDATVTEKLKKAGAIILAKVTLGEMGGGDSFGSLYGESRNPYDPERTVGGSSGGSGAAVSANFATLGIGQEGFASIRRPSAWNSIVGMRPTPGLVSRAGVYAGWPGKTGSLGPMARTVTDLARLLDVMVGYDPEDPMTAYGVGKAPDTYTRFLQKNGLKGARIGILRTPMGYTTEPDSLDFKTVTDVFDKAVVELKAAGAEVVDPIEIPRLNELLAKRASSPTEAGESTRVWLDRNPNSPFKTADDIRNHPDSAKSVRLRPGAPSAYRTGDKAYFEYLQAREELMTNVLKVMADYKLDAIVHKTVEHTPTLIKEGIGPPYVNQKGAPHLNTFLIFAASLTVPAGFTPEGLPVGITFFGRPYREPDMIRFGYAYEQATHHRIPPKTVPALSSKLASK